MAELFQEAEPSHLFRGGEEREAISPDLGYSPAPTHATLLQLFFIGHFHKASHVIASRRKFDYDEPACARSVCIFFLSF